jgi:pyruvate dehydrogenase E2 component (dihydrolipoamide acetyltransferase)
MASPAARVRAHELGIDLATLKGSGPGGVIVLGDVRGARPASTPAPKPKPTGSPMEEMRKAIAAAMTRAKRTIPHFYLSETIDVDPAIRFLEDAQRRPPADRTRSAGRGFRARRDAAAAKVPVMNGHYTEEAATSPPTPSIPASPSRSGVAASWRPR